MRKYLEKDIPFRNASPDKGVLQQVRQEEALVKVSHGPTCQESYS